MTVAVPAVPWAATVGFPGAVGAPYEPGTSVPSCREMGLLALSGASADGPTRSSFEDLTADADQGEYGPEPLRLPARTRNL